MGSIPKKNFRGNNMKSYKEYAQLSPVSRIKALTENVPASEYLVIKVVDGVDTDIVFRGIKSEADKKAEYLNACCLNPVYLADFTVTYKVEKGDYILNSKKKGKKETK